MSRHGRDARWSNEPTVVLGTVDETTMLLPTVPAGGQEQADSTGSLTRNSSSMAIASLVSRATGFVRAAAIAAAIGGALVGDDYTLANNLPNIVYELLLGGVLSSVLIPTLVRARKEEPDKGQAYAQRLLTLAVVAIGAATVVVVIAAPVFTALLASSNNTATDRHLITNLSYLLLPEIFFYGMAGIFAAILNTRGHFAAPMWTPILNNIVVIITAGVFYVMRPGHSAPTPDNITVAQLLVLGVGTTFGIVVQAAGLWPALRKVGFRWAWRWDWRKLHLRELAQLGVWMLLYVGVNQIGNTVVLKIGKAVGSQVVDGKHVAGAIVYNNAFLIFMMANGIVAVSVVTALMPRMAAAAADGRLEDLKDQLSQGTRLASVILIPAAVLYIILGRPLAIGLFEGGNYTQAQAISTGWVVTVSGFGLLPFAISQMQNSTYYALRDTRTPALINVPVIGIRMLIDIVFYFVLPSTIVTASLMGGTAISFGVGLFLGYWMLHRRLGPLGLRRVADTLIRLGIAAVVAALPAYGAYWIVKQLIGEGKIASLLEVAVGGTVLAVCYAVLAIALKVPEVRQLGAGLRARLGR